MSETLSAPDYDPALWAEAVAWQQECGVFDLLSPDPVDAFAARDAARAAPVEAAPAAIRPPTATTPPKPAPAVAPKPAQKPAQNQHARRGLEAAADFAEAERRAAVCTTVEELRAAVEAFDGCLLKETASNTVFGDGPEDADIMLIGRHPVQTKTARGAPLSGGRGKCWTRCSLI